MEQLKLERFSALVGFQIGFDLFASVAIFLLLDGVCGRWKEHFYAHLAAFGAMAGIFLVHMSCQPSTTSTIAPLRKVTQHLDVSISK